MNEKSPILKAFLLKYFFLFFFSLNSVIPNFLNTDLQSEQQQIRAQLDHLGMTEGLDLAYSALVVQNCENFPIEAPERNLICEGCTRKERQLHTYV